jgi:energy-coupling factor transport system permease protein
MHPLSRVLLVLWITSLAVVLRDPWLLLGLVGFSLLLSLLLSRRQLGSLLKSLRVICPVILSVFLIQILFRRGGNKLLDLGLISIYSQGLELGLEVALRLLILLFSATLLSALSYAELRLALRWLPEELSFLISYVLHLLPKLRERLKQVSQGLRQRGIVQKELSLKEKILVYRILSLAVLASLLQSSEMQAIQLELRGFRRQGKKSFLYHRKPSVMDFAMVVVLVVLSFLLASLHYHP